MMGATPAAAGRGVNEMVTSSLPMTTSVTMGASAVGIRRGKGLYYILFTQLFFRKIFARKNQIDALQFKFDECLLI